MTVERFRKVWALLPEQEKNLPIIIIGDETITWKEAYKEIIIKKTKLGKKIQKKMEDLELI